MAKQMRKLKAKQGDVLVCLQKQCKEAVRRYVLAHLVEACEDFADVQSDLLTAQLHPERMPHVIAQRAELELFAEQKLSHIEQVIVDLRRLK